MSSTLPTASSPPSGDGPFADDWGANRYDLLGNIINQAIQRGDDLGAALANIFPPPDHPQPTLGPEAHLAFENVHTPESVRHPQPRPDPARQTTAASGNPDTSNISTFDIAQSRLQDLMAAQTYVQIMDEDVPMSDQTTNANTVSRDQSPIPWPYYFQQLDGQYKRKMCTIMTGPTNIQGPGPFDVPYGDLGPRMRLEGHDYSGYGYSSARWSCLKMTIFGLKISPAILKGYSWQVFEVEGMVDFSTKSSCSTSQPKLLPLLGREGQDLECFEPRSKKNGKLACCHHGRVKGLTRSDIHVGVTTVAFKNWIPKTPPKAIPDDSQKGKPRAKVSRHDVLHVIRGTPTEPFLEGNNIVDGPTIWSAPFGILKGEANVEASASDDAEASESDSSQLDSDESASRKRKRTAIAPHRKFGLGEAGPSNHANNATTTNPDIQPASNDLRGGPSTSDLQDSGSNDVQSGQSDRRSILNDTSGSDESDEGYVQIRNEDLNPPTPIIARTISQLDFAQPHFIEQIVEELAKTYSRPGSTSEVLSISTHGARGPHMDVGRGAHGSVQGYRIAAEKENWHKSPLVKDLFKTLLARVQHHQDELIASSVHGRFVPYLGDVRAATSIFEDVPRGMTRFVGFTINPDPSEPRRDIFHILARLAFLTHIVPNAVRDPRDPHNHRQGPIEITGQVCVESHTLYHYHRALHAFAYANAVPTKEQRLRFWRFLDIEYCDYVAYFASQPQTTRELATRNFTQAVAFVRTLMSNQRFFDTQLNRPFTSNLEMDRYTVLNADPTDWLADSFTRLWT